MFMQFFMLLCVSAACSFFIAVGFFVFVFYTNIFFIHLERILVYDVY